MKIIVFAFGGNQIARKGLFNTKDQLDQAGKTASILADFITENKEYNYVISHGNGPQVGEIHKYMPVIPLYIADAMSQGQIAYMIQQEMNRYLRGIDTVGIITQVLVDKDDPAFKRSTKFIGVRYASDELLEMGARSDGSGDYHLGDTIYRLYEKDAYRKVVPSPKPIEIVEFPAIIALLDKGIIPISIGGGGIPVSHFIGQDAVVDKDLASSLLASKLKKHYDAKVTLVILTAVESVYTGFKTPEQKKLSRLTADEAESYLDAGEFPEGSMGPKIKAAIDAVRNGVSRVIITNPDNFEKAMEGKAGTIITV